MFRKAYQCAEVGRDVFIVGVELWGAGHGCWEVRAVAGLGLAAAYRSRPGELVRQ